MSEIKVVVPEFMKQFRYIRPVIDFNGLSAVVVEWQGANAVEDVVLERWVKFRRKGGMSAGADQTEIWERIEVVRHE